MRRSILTSFFTTARWWMALLVIAAPACAEKAAVVLSFHDSVLVNDTVFTVGDIAAVSGGSASTAADIQTWIAGTSAPPGYSRFLSSADFVAFRLAVAFPEVEFSVAGSSRPQIRTDYRMVTLQQYETVVRTYIDSVVGWKTGEWSMTLLNRAESCKCLNGPVRVSADGLADRFPKGNTFLVLQVHQGSRTFKIPVRCHFSVHCRVLVAKREIARGTALSMDDCEMKTMDLTRFAPAPFSSMSRVEEVRAARTIKPGTILHNRLVVKIPVIEKGESVSIIYTKGRFTIAVAGVARENGGKGDRIWVENLNTHKLLHVVVEEKGKVHALQGGVSI